VNDITVVVPTVPQRGELLGRALASVSEQIAPPDAVIVVYDTGRWGGPATRTKGLEMVQTEWTAFLDDDDEFMPQHLQNLKMHQETTGADMVFPWFRVIGGGYDPFPHHQYREYDVNNPHQTTVTFLVRTKAALAVGGFIDPDYIDPELDPGKDAEGHRAGEEFRMVLRLAQAGYKIAHLQEMTWKWRHWGGNSMGLPSKLTR
jgi:hypothetical protein